MQLKTQIKTQLKKVVLPTLLSLIVVLGFAQNNEITIQIKDKDSQQPISYAHFQYGKQKGLSDENGKITLLENPESQLYLSHVLYGQIKLESDSLTIAINSGILQLTELEVALKPAIIMGLHTNKYPDQQLEINYQDLLTHDAGAFLEQSLAISSIKKSGAYGFDPVFRGFKYDQLNIVVDGGQCATAACPNRMDPPASQVSLNMMDRVEVLKGPHSLRYGNSFGGTFHFISPEPEYTDKIKPTGRISGSYESNGNIKRTEAMLGASEKWFNIRIFGSHSTGDNYEDGLNEEIPADFLRNSFGGNIDFKLTQNQDLSISITKNIARDVDFPSLPMDLRKDNTTLANIKHNASFINSGLKSVKTMVFGSYVDHEMDNLSKIIEPRMVDAITIANTQNYGGRTEFEIDLSSAKLYTGIDLRITEQDGDRNRTFLMGPNSGNTVSDNVWQDSKMQQVGLFGEFHSNIRKLNFVAALRLDINDSEIRDPADEFLTAGNSTSQSYKNLSASIGFNRNIAGNKTIGLWLGRAQRSGSITELYINYFPVGLDGYELVGNPDLKAEINNQLDLNFKWQTIKSVIDINVFTSYLTDYISSEIREDLNPRMMQAPGVRQYKNIDKAVMTGFEANWSQELIWNLNHRFGVAYTFTEDLSTNNPLPEIPPMEFGYTLKGKYLKNKLEPELGIKYSLEQNRISSEFGETQSPSFTLVDIKLSYQIARFIVISGGVTNLFNEAYYEHLSRSMKIENGKPLYARGRSGFITALLRF